MSLNRIPESADPILLDGEPPDISDLREVRHWISVYTSLLETSRVTFEPPVPEALLRRARTWQTRLGFWQGRAREIKHPRSVGRRLAP